LQAFKKDYSPTPLERSHTPPRRNAYLGYRSCLRLEFRYECAYCLSHEHEVAPSSSHGQFEVDHFRPVSSFGHLKNVYGNLYWSCHACNHAKRETWPTADEAAKGYRFLDVCGDSPSDHLAINGDEVVAKTTVGQYTIEEINLNSSEHRQRRSSRRKQLDLWQLLTSVASSLPDAVQRRDVERESDAILELILGTKSPWDPVLACLCNGVMHLVI